MPFALTILKEKHKEFIKNSKNFLCDFMTMTFDTKKDNYYNNMIIKITTGAGVEQIRTITNYVKVGQIATINSDWITIPNNTSDYRIYSTSIFVTGTSQGGNSSTTIKL